VNEIMPDLSPWAFTPSLGFAAKMVTLNLIVFWLAVLLLFWISSRGRQPVSLGELAPEQGAGLVPPGEREVQPS
jgi:hypothetical protein